MKISEVYMVRSAKGNDMLCVDSFLYYYDDRGLTTYRWSCNRRKDKVVPCRSRIITKILDDDEAKHMVVKVFGTHSHDQCSPEEISKAFERKRIANLAGKPCTLEAKAEKRRLLRLQDDMDDGSDVPEEKRMKVEWDDSGSGYEERANEGVENLDKKTNTENTDSLIESLDTNAVPTTLKKNNIYMLKTSHGRDMVCVDGYLYRLEGISYASSTFRWECSRRRDDGCKARIQTTRIHDRKHVLKQRRSVHTHSPYAQDKLLKLFTKNFNRSCAESNVADASEPPILKNIEEFEKINVVNGAEFLKEMINPTVASSVPVTAQVQDNIYVFETKTTPETYNAQIFEENVIEEVEGDIEEEEKYDPKELASNDDNNTEDPLEESERTNMDLTQIGLLPSAKGNKLLCIDNFLYHFDSKSANKKRIYWTCVHRRNKIYSCRARVTTDMKVDSGLKIIKASGSHLHSRDIEKIKARLCNEFVAKAANATDMKPMEYLKSSVQELGGNLKDVVVNSMDTIRRKISKLRYKIKQKNKKSNLKRQKSESISSLSSALNSDDDEELPALPTKLEHMKTNVKEISLTEAFKPTVSDMNYDAKEGSLQDYASKVKTVKIEERLSYSEEPADNSKGSLFGQNESEYEYEEIISDMDLSKVTTLRSAKGGELLCIDSYLYHVKSARQSTTYWECIKSKHKVIKCKSRVITIRTSKGYVVRKVTNQHSHHANKAEVKKRILKSLHAKNAAKLTDIVFCNTNDFKEGSGGGDSDGSTPITTKFRMPVRKDSSETRSIMKLYSVSDGPPSLAVRMTLKALKIPFELVNIDFCAGEHMTEEYAKMNPQKEIPVLDDDGFYLSESIAIMQYLCDKYAPHSSLYPIEASKRALVNQRLCFNMGFYYSSISVHVMAPIFFDYPRSEMSLKKVKNALAVFETYLKRSETKYAAADNLTIADFALITATLCLEAIGFDLAPYPLIKKWYGTFKQEYASLWEVANEGLKEIEEFEKNPPDLSNMNHPFHPTRKPKITTA